MLARRGELTASELVEPETLPRWFSSSPRTVIQFTLVGLVFALLGREERKEVALAL